MDEARSLMGAVEDEQSKATIALLSHLPHLKV